MRRKLSSGVYSSCCRKLQRIVLKGLKHCLAVICDCGVIREASSGLGGEISFSWNANARKFRKCGVGIVRVRVNGYLPSRIDFVLDAAV